MRKNIFVFVVCGADSHIRTLNYSIGHLKHFSGDEILVVTDLARNSLEIDHDNVMDITTPPNLTHHQASIYLKVGLHKFVDLAHQYCYLDSDVVAVDKGVDAIFTHMTAPITFASDHCTMAEFSPTAVECSCIEDRQRDIDLLERLEASYLELEARFHEDLKAFNDHYIPKDPKSFENYKKLQGIIQEYSEDLQWFLKSPSSFQFIMARLKPSKYNFEKFLKSKGDFLWDDKSKQAFDSAGNLLYDANADPPQHPSYYHHIKSNSQFIWSDLNTFWLNKKGEDIYSVANCEHLKKLLLEKFGLAVNHTWQHWNGGVFLFNEQSVEFMEKWFQNTVSLFEDKNWKTRDQGSLIATVWELGLEEQQRIPTEFNLLADAQNEQLRYRPKKGISLNSGASFIRPKLIHVYHDFGKKGWDVWDYIEGATSNNNAIPEPENKAEDNTNKIIHGLWIGTELSSIELLTISSFIDKGHDFHLWVYDEISTPLPQGVKFKDASKIIPRDQVFAYKKTNQFGHGKGSFAGFSDIFRYKLLYEKGGWWVDMDVCCLKPFAFEDQYVFRKHHQLPAVGNMMKCPKGSEVMKTCYEEAISTVTENNTDWHKPITILNKNIERFNLGSYIQRISNEDNWSEIVPLLNVNNAHAPNWYAIHWANENWRARNVNKTEFVKDSCISKLMHEHEIEHDVTNKPVDMDHRLSFETVIGKLRKLALPFS